MAKIVTGSVAEMRAPNRRQSMNVIDDLIRYKKPYTKPLKWKKKASY